jgi:hypothetical protein
MTPAVSAECIECKDVAWEQTYIQSWKDCFMHWSTLRVCAQLDVSAGICLVSMRGKSAYRHAKVHTNIHTCIYAWAHTSMQTNPVSHLKRRANSSCHTYAHPTCKHDCNTPMTVVIHKHTHAWHAAICTWCTTRPTAQPPRRVPRLHLHRIDTWTTSRGAMICIPTFTSTPLNTSHAALLPSAHAEHSHHLSIHKHTHTYTHNIIHT